MKVCELYDHVAQLGFEDTMLEYDRHFILSANRALFEVASLRPQTSHVLIHHEPMENMIKNYSFAPVKKMSDIVYTADGAKAFYFEACGYGYCHVERCREVDNVWVWEDCYAPIAISSPGTYMPFRNFITVDSNFVNGEVRLRFTGDYTFYVRNAALYEEILGPNVSDIPAFEPFTSYDVPMMADDFLRLYKPPIVDDGTHAYLRGSEYDIENGKAILLPYDKPGVYKVRYIRKPAPIVDTESPATLQDVIDLDEDLCQLMPLLIAAYVWADDEDAKAQYYLSQYQQQAALIRATEAKSEPVQYRSTYGW